MFIRIANSFHLSDAYNNIISVQRVIAEAEYTRFVKNNKVINAIAAMDTRDMR